MCGVESGTGCTNANGKTTDDMKKLYTFNSFGGNWDILGGQTDLNDGYPYLSWQAEADDYVWYILDDTESPFCGGTGIEGDEYQICDWTGLNAVRNNLSAYFILNNSIDQYTSDYDTIGNAWMPIGDCGGDDRGLSRCSWVRGGATPQS